MKNKFLTFALGLRQKYPKFDLYIKEDNLWMKRLYKWSLMKYWNPDFLTNVATTIGYAVYMPKSLIGTDVGYLVLRHEAIHIAQWKRWGLLFWLTYLFCLPSIFSLRAYWEFQAYKENLRVELEESGKIRLNNIHWMAEMFCGPTYLWMFPFRKTVKRLIIREISNLLTAKLR